MKKLSLSKMIFVCVLSVCLIMCLGMFLATTNTAKAESTISFEMDEGAYAKLVGDGGMRMRVKMDEATKNSVVEDGNELFFLLMTKEKFDGAKTQDGYSFDAYLTNCDNFNEDGCKKVVADKDKIYHADGIYYANLLIYNFPDTLLNTELCVVAGKTVDGSTSFASFENETQVCKTMYGMINHFAFNDYTSEMFNVYGSWYATEKYPVLIETQAQYSKLEGFSGLGVNLAGKHVEIGAGIERDLAYESEVLSDSNITAIEVVDLSSSIMYDFVLSTNEDFNVAFNGLSAQAVEKMTFEDGTAVEYTADGDNFIFDYDYIASIGTGEFISKVYTADKLYIVKNCIVTEVVNSWDRFKVITKDAEATNYYILGDNITAGSVTSQSRNDTEFAGVLDGRGHVITGMTITATNYYLASFIKTLSGTVKNIAFVDTEITTTNAAGGTLCNRLTGTLDNVYMDVTVNSTTNNRTAALYDNGVNAQAIKNCIVAIEVGSVVGDVYGFGYNITSASQISNGYLISSSVTRFTQTVPSPSGSAKFTSAPDFFSKITSLSSGNGWSSYWSIDSEGLYLDGNKLLDSKVVVDLTNEDYFYDFDLTDTTDYAVNIAELKGYSESATLSSLTIGETVIDGATLDSGFVTIPLSQVSALVVGDYVMTMQLSNGYIYKLNVSIVTEVVNSWDRFKVITKDSVATNYYILGDNITAGSVTSQSRNNTVFAGVLDGRGHVITGMTITDTDQHPASFIKTLRGTVKNIAFVDTEITTTNAVGGTLCNTLSGTLDNVYMDVTVNSTTNNRTAALYDNGLNAQAIKNCIVAIEKGSVVGSVNGFGFNITSASQISNGYLISSSVTSFTASVPSPSGSAKFTSESNFLKDITSLSSENGWSRYWSIDSEGLKMGGTKLF